MKFVFALVLCLVASVSFGQQYAPGSTAVVNQQAVVQQQPAMVPVPPMNGPGLPFHEWRDGMRETWTNTHEIRPVRPWEGGGYAEGAYPAYPQPLPAAPAYSAPAANNSWYGNQGFTYYPPTGCYQRPVQPSYQQPVQCYQQQQPCYRQPTTQQWYPGYYMGF